MENVPLSTHVGRIFIVFLVLSTLTLVFTATSVAQTNTSDPLADQQAQVSSEAGAAGPNELGPVNVRGCSATEDATLFVRGADNATVTISNQNNDFLVDENRITVTGTISGELIVDPAGQLSDGLATIVSSTGITCTDVSDDGGSGRGGTGGDGGGATDRQSRTDDGQGNADRQYGKPIIIKKTIVKGLPKTGGPSPLLLPLAAAFVVAGIAVVRRS